ncbi:hypothetical protein KY290_008070 [Solanum tuberosum]|uniref:Uncharacterized protein n=1 Tax=Solanum tuberosum TaxID=4113 RepID=A0ABQ7W7C6_SOLTU|nr:hypothetical protein KY290_008070 [Solanum tuberosum]
MVEDSKEGFKDGGRVHGSKKGFKDGGRVNGNGLRKGLRTVEETMVSEPILEPKSYENYSKAMVHRFKDSRRVHGR